MKKTFPYLVLALLLMCCPSGILGLASEPDAPGTVQEPAGSVCGRVVDAKGKPIEYAGIYFKGRPDAGTVSDKLGYFSLEATSPGDTLVVTMLGYVTVYKPASKLGKSLNIKLKERPMEIDASVVQSSRGGSRSKRNKEIRAVLNQVYDRLLSVDYATPRFHQIASDIAVYSEDSLIMRNRLTGLLYQSVQSPDENAKDTVWIKMDSYQSFLQDDIRSGLADLEESGMKMSTDERKLVKAFASPERNKTLPHRVVWKMDAMTVFSRIYKDSPNHWAISARTDSSFVLTYYKRYDYLGVAKADLLFAFEIYAVDFSIRKMSGDSKAYLNLPISYKFTPAELTVLNLVCVDGEDLTKYRLKKAEFSSCGQILFERIGGIMVPVDKSLRNTILTIDNKKVPYFFRNDCTQIVTR